MDVKVKKAEQSEEDIRKGPWSVEEDTILVNYVATHGHGRWNSLARCAGLKRSGKSCRLRWLNYLRPDVRRGNITLQEQITILDLHSRWGNRWSKIARHLPGRTDNEIKNYWRTRVIKQAKNLNCDVDSKQFKDVLRYDWMPRLIERMHPPSQTFVPAHVGPDPDPDPDPAALPHASASTALDSSCAQFQAPFHSQHFDYNASGVFQSFNFDDQMLEQGNTMLPLGGGDLDLMESLWEDENMCIKDTSMTLS